MSRSLRTCVNDIASFKPPTSGESSYPPIRPFLAPARITAKRLEEQEPPVRWDDKPRQERDLAM
ncbi:hypothetical protein BM221_009062 [Beauveria bassiana]|uniref:Uncharacterized protein n=1 Tax=Beauveria bassiana TaxID=176275 RepID=A0A2N6NC67_BEABA|nr:hypothetical protein BM221_009062 [Beauveria bassiana]